jgi:hypothetical protein
VEEHLRVLDHEPQFWFLLQDSGALFLDVACSHGAVGYGFLMELNEEEVREYKADGHPYLCRLAEAINYSAPGVRGNSSPYKERNILRSHADAVSAAVQGCGVP